MDSRKKLSTAGLKREVRDKAAVWSGEESTLQRPRGGDQCDNVVCRDC